jgi:thiol:disulfide interchange protein DsbC
MFRMSRITTRILVSLALLLPFAAFSADDAELETVRQKVMAMFDGLEAQNIQPSVVDGWYSIQKGPIVAYISADGRYLMQGDMVDLETQVNLTEEARTGMRKDLLAQIAEEDFITFAPAEVKYSVSIFTDVDCTYCRKLHAQIDEYMASGIEVKYLLYPRNGPASSSWSTAEDIWCAKDRNHALTMAKLDRGFSTSKCEATTVRDHYLVGQDVGLSGTPAIVFDDGTLVGGYLPPAALLQRLQSNAANSQ